MQIEIIKNRLVPYQEAMHWFDNLNQITQNNEKIIIFEHQDIYTCGKSINDNIENTINGVKAIKTQRGGLWTWHGKGQVMIYFILNLRKRKITLTDWFCLIEPVIIKCIEEEIINNIGLSKNELSKILQIYADKNKRGFWIKNKQTSLVAKIGFIGLRITSGFLTRGISINYNNDLSAFTYINPCGLGDVKITSISKIINNLKKTNNHNNELKKDSTNDFKSLLANNLQATFK